MTFNLFSSQLSKIANAALGGDISHNKVEPAARITFMKNFDISTLQPRNAAVMMLIYPKNNVAHFALIVRTSYNGVHSSQVAFPGGKAENFDENFWQTAVRETEEEIGIVASKINFLKNLTPVYVPPSNFMVYPFVGFCTEEISFIPDAREVADILEVSIEAFLNENNAVKKTINASYMDNVEVDGFQIKDFFVWGATAMMMQEFKDLLQNIV